MSDRKHPQGGDRFADIAAMGIGRGTGELIVPEPPEREEKLWGLDGREDEAVFVPSTKLETAGQLREELERQRAYYEPFLNDLAPPLASHREKIPLETFDWRLQTEADLANFSEVLEGRGHWERVRIPHYGGPLGAATTYYRTEFTLSEAQWRRGDAFLCFRGVDYKAHVFLNDHYIGSHEGFFAPFEFSIAAVARIGTNVVTVKVENDYICLGNSSESTKELMYGGDKIYAATGVGYDDPERGWHHCPPGMGIYQDVFVELRPRLAITDIFVRPLPDEGMAEARIEVFNSDVEPKELSLRLSVYGQNFEECVFSDRVYTPSSSLEVGLGDSLTEAQLRAAGTLHRPVALRAEKGVNFFAFRFEMPNFRLWEPSTPWLYQLQATLTANEVEVDASKRQFGMRSFRMEETGEKKGMFYFNGRPIRLRGANTMGHEQQCVMKKDWAQLIDDLLLAKIANMNFLRLTQRPVQQEVYEYCDRLGLMTQTDLPLFGVLRKNQFVEAARQAGEMERIVRSHPCNILVSYINEPFPNAGNKPHRHLTRPELHAFFEVADRVVRLHNPDRVIKHVDGDYEPPGPGLPDNHCYPAWYNGHGVDIGRLQKGYWMHVKPGWYYGCGEFGAEGLDPVAVMRKYYPAEWLPANGEDERRWTPNRIVGAQTGNFHYFYYETPQSLEQWVEASHKHQAWATRIMTEAFRRNADMVTFAIHLFIDAFPSGWMKTIMDVDRQPKPAYFAYREALTPLMANLRADRLTYTEGEDVELEAWICNDTTEAPTGATLRCQVELDGDIVAASRTAADVPSNGSAFQGRIRFRAPAVGSRRRMTVRLALFGEGGELVHDTSLELGLFPKPEESTARTVCIAEADDAASRLVRSLGRTVVEEASLKGGDAILIADWNRFREREADIMARVAEGATAVLLELPPGEHVLAGDIVHVKPCGMLPVHFVGRNTGHAVVDGFEPEDFRLWYDASQRLIAPLLETTFEADGWSPIVTSGNTKPQGGWGPALAAAERAVGNGKLRICQVKLLDRVETNPVAMRFAARLLDV